MTSKPWIMPALIGVLLLATAVLWWRAAMRPTPPLAPGTPTAAEVRTLQAQSDAACRCARQRGGSPWRADCWAEFERNLSRFEHSSTGTMCGEESVSLECFGPFGNEPCILKQRMYGGCSAAESERLEARARARREGGCTD